jgi:class 3 adenylate cyclase
MQLEDWKKELSTRGEVKWPAAPTLEFFWHFKIRGSREEIWAHLSDTSRLNREMGFATRQQVEHDGKMLVNTTMLGFPQQWVEEPWAWLSNFSLVSHRTYFYGIAKTVHSVFDISSDAPAEFHTVTIYFGWEPKNWFGKLFLRATENLVRNKFARAFRKIENHLAQKKSTPVFLQAPPALAPAAAAKISSVKAQLLEQKMNARVIDELMNYVENGDELDLEPIRVLRLAHLTQLPEREILKTCLHATRFGLLKMSWDVICPHCRGSRYSAESLGDIPASAACAVCEIDFNTDDANSIEVFFHVHPSIRKVEALLFCAAEPAKKNHIHLQQPIRPGEILKLKPALPEGIYRVRCIGEEWQLKLDVSRQAAAGEVHLSAPQSEAVMHPEATLCVHHQNTEPRILVIEELGWETSALKPAQILALPEFRDLFAEEHLSSDVKLFLGEQTILFTDIVGSTRFYDELGDAKAFAQVRSHFQEVFQEVHAQQGVIVKTIGDAVMASFPSAREALAAAIQIQQKFHEQRTDTSIRLRISVHSGPVIAVQLNSGLDYFGNTVNLAAKIQSCAGAGEIALSAAVYRLGGDLPGVKNFRIENRKNARDGGNDDVFVMQVHAQIKAASA